MIKEVWKDIEGYEGHYQVSNLGRIKSLARLSEQNNILRERILRTQDNKSNKNEKGYLYVDLYKDKKKKKHYVHRLVALAFVDNKNNYPEINHKDCDTYNNYADNIEWCTHKYNLNYGDRALLNSLARKGKKTGKDNENSLRVICETTGEIFDCIREAADFYGIQKSRNAISGCCKGKHKFIGKLKDGTPLVWRYYDDYLSGKEET